MVSLRMSEPSRCSLTQSWSSGLLQRPRRWVPSALWVPAAAWLQCCPWLLTGDVTPKQNNHPILALLPAVVLRQLRDFREHLCEKQLQDIADKYVWQLVLAILALVIFNSANATVFGVFALINLLVSSRSLKASLFGYALAVWLGGIYAMFNAIVAWLEVLAFRGGQPHCVHSKPNLSLLWRQHLLPLILFPLILHYSMSGLAPLSFCTVLIVFASVVSFRCSPMPAFPSEPFSAFGPHWTSCTRGSFTFAL